MAPTETVTRRPTRTELRRQHTRVALRAAAYDLMSVNGVDATTIQQITDTADIGFGTFYNYYPHKDALALEVLDCVVHNIGERNDLVTQQLGETDPVAIVGNSVRFVIREFTTNPLWRWWFTRLDLLVDRSRRGFGPFGLRDIARAVEAGHYHLISDDPQIAWSHLNWMMAAACRDIVDGLAAPEKEADYAEAILRVMGVEHEHARRAVSTVLLPSPVLPIDFTFELAEADSDDDVS